MSRAGKYVVEIHVYPEDRGKYDPNALDRMADVAGMIDRNRPYRREPTWAERKKGVMYVAGIRGYVEVDL